jgi:FkbM family methyltransferase
MFAFREMYEPELRYLERLLSPGMTFVDVGACYGVYTLVAAKLVGPNGRVFAFEPARRAYDLLQRNIQLDGLANVHPYRMALSDRIGIVSLYHHPDSSRNSLGTTEESTDPPEEVQTSTLDAILESTPPVHIDVMKLDVEGAEELVLRGARETLSATLPAIIFEVNPEAATALGLSPRGTWDFLDRMGYAFYCLSDGTRLAALRCAPPGGNVVALHPTRIL